jgi:hypothetical protein
VSKDKNRSIRLSYSHAELDRFLKQAIISAIHYCQEEQACQVRKSEITVISISKRIWEDSKE